MNPAFLFPLAEKIFDCRLVKSGTVADVWKIALDTGIYCFKHYKDGHALLRQQAECNDLILLSGAIPESVPKIHKAIGSQSEATVLCLDWIENGLSGNQSRKSVAKVLSELHEKKADFAGLHYANYIGELPQDNETETHWPSFWVDSRLSPQLNLAVDNELLTPDELKLLENYISKVPVYLPELKSFALLHGDLWKGNVLTDQNGKTFLIDPAVYFGDPWVDLAMTALFGGFGRNFYEEYFELNPSSSKRKELIPHYQLYYLLVHLNMFGRSYYPDIAGILERYV